MDQKNRLLREAFEMLVGLVEGSIRPLGSHLDKNNAIHLRDRIAKNLKIDYSNLR